MLPDEKIYEVQEYLAMGFSYQYIYKRTGVSRPTISDIKTGKRKPEGETPAAHECRVINRVAIMSK